MIKNNDDIGYFGLKYTPERIFLNSQYFPTESFFSRDLLTTTYRINTKSVLWRKNWILELLNKNESAWKLEANASERSRRYPYKVLEINNVNNTRPGVFYYHNKIKYGYGITRGQWLPKNIDLFKKEKNKVDFLI